MVRVMDAAGVDEMGILTAQCLRLGVHGVHKGGNGAAVPFCKDIAGFVGGDDEHTLKKLLYRQHLAGLDAGGASVGSVVGGGKGTFRGGDLLRQQRVIAAGLFQNQQGGHDLSETCGVILLMDVLGIGYGVCVHIHQQRRLGADVRRVRCLRGNGQQNGKTDAEQKNRQKAFDFHIFLL